jgi:4-carboxymuconolactone decarboxylase
MPAGPPRIEPVPSDQWDERLTRLLTSAPGGTEEPMHLFTTLAHQPELFRRWLGFGGALLSGRLPGRLRELVILRTAYRFDAPYEWAHHIELAEAQGISGVEVAAVGGHLAVVDWDPFERAALAAVDETKDQGAVTGRLDRSDLVELVMLIGHYVLLSTVLRSLRLPLEPSAAALAEGVAGGPPA